MGGLFSLPVAFSGLLAPNTVEFSKSELFLWTVIPGMIIYRLLIEIVTSGILRPGRGVEWSYFPGLAGYWMALFYRNKRQSI
jgi:hypothetical protein